MASKLFLVLKSPGEWGGMDLLKSLAEDDSAVVLLNDAVMFALRDEGVARLKEACTEVYAMKDDLQGRGIRPADGVVEIDYPRLVELIMDDFQQTITV